MRVRYHVLAGLQIRLRKPKNVHAVSLLTHAETLTSDIFCKLRYKIIQIFALSDTTQPESYGKVWYSTVKLLSSLSIVRRKTDRRSWKLPHTLFRTHQWFFQHCAFCAIRTWSIFFTINQHHDKCSIWTSAVRGTLEWHHIFSSREHLREVVTYTLSEFL